MYTKFYGLSAKPFENTPDPAFLYPSKSHREALASLHYGVDEGKGFILITGDIGTGKTTIIRALQKEIDPSCLVLNIINPKWTYDQVIKHLARKLGVEISGKDNFEVLESLATTLEKLDQAGRRFILIFDEAHLLSEDTLEDIRLLSNIETDRKKLLQIVLVGQGEIYNTLQRPALRTLEQRITMNRVLSPLDKNESKSYINHRLRLAGSQGQLFSRQAMSFIWKKSQGVPRLINHICDNALLIGFALEAPIIDKKVIKEVVDDRKLGVKNRVAFFRLDFSWRNWIGTGLASILLVGILAFGDWSIPPSNLKNSNQPTLISPVLKEIPVQRKPILTENINRTIVSAVVQKKDSGNTRAPSDLPKNFNVEKSTTTKIAEKYEGTEPNELTAKPLNTSEINNTQDTFSRDQSDGIEKILPSPAYAPAAPSVKETRMKKNSFTRIVVKPKDNLWKIAVKNYGRSNSTIVDHIHMANPAIVYVDQIYVGQIILLPKIQIENLIIKNENGIYQIHYASFYRSEDASRCFAELSEKNKKCVVKRTDQQKSKVYRIYYGEFRSYEEAKSEIENLHLKYLDFVI